MSLPVHHVPNSSYWSSELKSRVSGDESLAVTTNSPLGDSEVVIIGGGISGIATAYWLLKSGCKNILLLESRKGICEGATGRNGGHMWPCARLLKDSDITKLGLAMVDRLYQFDYLTMALTEQFVEENNVNCNYQVTGALDLAQTKEEVVQLEKDQKVLQKIIGRFDVVPIHTGEQLYRETHTLHFLAGLYQARVGRFSPGIFTTAVAHKAQEMGLKIRTDATVTAVDRRSDGQYTLKVVSPSASTSAVSITARVLIHATNAHAAAIIPELKSIIKPVRGQVIVTSPTVLRFPCSMSWNDQYEYMRQTDDGRIIFGGLRTVVEGKQEGISDDSVVVPEISTALLNRLFECFPSLKDENLIIEHQWTGIMGFTPDENPLVGPLWSKKCEPMRGEYIIAGFSGNGMPRIFASAKALAEMVCGQLKPKQWLGPFSPMRFRELSKKKSKL